VQFTDTSTGSPTSWSWSFGDGHSATQQNPTHSYISAGNYLVTLTATNQYGSNTSSKWLTVVANGSKPTASFTWSPVSPKAGQSVQFTDTSTGSPTSWSWSFGDGNASTSPNPSHSYNVAGTHTVQLTVKNQYGSSSKTNSLAVVAPAERPVVTDVARQYPGVFLQGTTVKNTFTIAVDWKGKPGKIEVSVNGGAPASVPGNPNGGSSTLRMASLPGQWQASTIEITPVNGAGIRGATHPEEVYVFPYPDWLGDALNSSYGNLSFSAGSGEVKAQLSLEFPQPHLNQGCTLECARDANCHDCIKIPDWVPYLGGTFDMLDTYGKIDGSVSSTGVGHFSLYGQTGFFALGGGESGGGVLGKVSGSGQFRFGKPNGLELTSAAMSFSLQGTIGKQVGIVDAIPQLAAIVPSFLKNTLNEHLSLSGEIDPSLTLAASFAQDDQGELAFREGVGTLGLNLKVALNACLVKGICATGWVAGGGAGTIGVPKPFVRSIKVSVEAGLRFNTFFWDSDDFKVAYGCTWTPTHGMHCGKEDPTQSITQQICAGSVTDTHWARLHAAVPDYSRFGPYARFQASPMARSMSTNVPVTVQQTIIVNNLYRNAQPAVIETSAGELLLWEHRDLGLPIEQSTDISWSLGNGDSWRTPAVIEHDTRAEFFPTAGLDTDGDVVAVWSRIKDSSYSQRVETLNDLQEFNTRMELVTSVFDPRSKSWSAITPLTNDSRFDGNEKIAGSGSSLLLTWLSNATGLFVSTPNSPSNLEYAWWNGSSWSNPKTVASSLVGVGRYAVAAENGHAFIILERDSNLSTDGDTVLDSYRWSNGHWIGPTRFASGGGDNQRPSVAYDSSGEAHVVWLRGSNLVHATLSDPTPRVIRPASGSLAIYNALLLNNASGNLTLIWQEAIKNGPASIVAMVYDPTSASWSHDLHLSYGGALARNVAGAFSDEGVLTLAYLATQIQRKSQNVQIGGSTWSIPNVPVEGRTDLVVLHHSLIVDLAISDQDLSMNPPRPQPGQSAIVTARIHNAGDFPTQSFGVDAFAGDPNHGGVLLASSNVAGPFPAGAAAWVQMPFTYPSSGGNIFVVIDAGDDISEASESNNIGAIYLDNRPPSTTATANVTDGTVPLHVLFDASGSTDPDGDALGFAWAFADGTSSVTGSRVDHVFNKPGEYPVTVAVQDTHGAVGTAVLMIHVWWPESPAIGTPGQHTYLIPASAHSPGEGGTRWISDMVMYNPGPSTATVNLYFLKTGQDNSGITGQQIMVSAGASVRLGDFVSSTFGQSSTSGALYIGADQPLVVNSRTYNNAPSGTYGQFIAGMPVGELIGPNKTVHLIQLTRNSHFRTNIGFANVSDRKITVKVKLYRNTGSQIATKSYTIEPYGFYQKTDIIGTNVSDAYALINSSTSGAKYYTYASVIDNRTGDPVFITRGEVALARQSLYIPGSAHVNGACGTQWRTDVEMYNPGSTTTTYRLELLKRGQANPAPRRKTFTIAPGHCVRYTDVLSSLFGFTGAAALRITPTTGTVIVTSRTYNQTSRGTYGQFILAVPVSRAIAKGESVPLVQLADSASTSSGYRTNIGFVNATDKTITVGTDLYDDGGTKLGTKTVHLRSYEYKQVDRIFRSVTSSTLDNCYAVLSTSTSGGAFLAYASVVDNRSGDPVYVPATGSGGGGGGTCTIEVTSPNGGESWELGSNHTVRWTKSGTTCGSKIKAELLKGSQVVSTIRTDTPNDGALSWDIPTSLTAASNYRVRLTDLGSTGASDTSNGYFSLTGGGGGNNLTVTLPGGVAMELIHVTAGNFTMGSPFSERGRTNDEVQHQVTLTHGYYIGKYEVTQAQWEAVMGHNPAHFKACGGNCPVENVSWEEICGGTTGSSCKANSFVGRLNTYLGTGKFRLPTEAEWEYATRAGTQTPFFFGDDTSCRMDDCSSCGTYAQNMWWCGNANNSTHAVGSKNLNPWGLGDVHGNVWELVADWWGAYPTSSVTDPKGPSSGTTRVIRSGSWLYEPRYCRSAYRYSTSPYYAHYNIGFRLARSE